MNSRCRARVAAIAAGAALLLLTSLAFAGDPYLRWYTLKTPRFHVHYHGGLEENAQRVANLAEAIHRRLVPHLGWQPTEIVHILLTDNTDSANGSATATPYDAVRMFVSAPDDMSPLGDYDDWLTELLTHEYTHILHVDNISGLPALFNAIFGKTYAPNQAQPRWILEGLAVAMESEHTGGGRLRSTHFDMVLRADVLEDNLARLDQISHPSRRWPSGNLWYLYGGKFIGWIVDVYGPTTYAAVATDYGKNPIAWGINRSIRRATGRTYYQLYDGWKHHLQTKYRAQAAEVRRRGLREGTRLTHRGRVAANPRFVPECARTSGREELLYYRDDGHTSAGFYRLPLASRDRADERKAQIVTRTHGDNATWDAECGLVLESIAASKRRYYFQDLFRLPPGVADARGLSRERQRLTVGLRARDPDLSPDGRLLTFVTNRGGTSTLRLADYSAGGGVANLRTLVRSGRNEQAFSPRFSHDGRFVAYSTWSGGGHRDIRVVELSSGRVRELTRDRAIDQQPTWSPDDRFVFFTSDRTGIANVYAHELATGTLRQVTNVLNGAYMPEITPDGETLFYVGYTHTGFDLFSMPLDRSRWLDAPAASEHRPEPHPEAPAMRYPVEPYSPLSTLRPRAYELEYGPGAFGQALRVATAGSDIVGHHAFSASVLVETEAGEPSATISYAYRRLPFDFRLSAFRSTAPRTGYRYGDETPVFVERMTGVSTGVSYSTPGEFDGQAVSLSYMAAEFDSTLPVDTLADPYAQVTRDPHRGFLGVLSLGYGYSNAEGTVYGIGAERGYSVGAGLDVAAPQTGSDETLTAISLRAIGYLPMPWLTHHTLALAASGAAAVGTYPRRGYYFTGGFVDLTPGQVIDAFDTGVHQGGFVLRGYRPAQFIGTHFNLLNAEYRFPIVYADRGVGTLPVFLRGVSGVVFADYGGAFNRIDLDDPFDQYHLGVGGELWIDLVVGYFARGNLRIGYARGLDDQAIAGGQTYLVLASAF
jgi:hypothetical protein